MNGLKMIIVAPMLYYLSFFSCNNPKPPVVHHATVGWQYKTPAGLSGFNVYRATGTAATAKFVKVNAALIPPTGSAVTFRYQDPTDLVPKVTYQYYVTAVEGAKESTPSPKANVTVPVN